MKKTKKRGRNPLPKKDIKQSIQIYKERWKIDLIGMEKCQEVCDIAIEKEIKKNAAEQR